MKPRSLTRLGGDGRLFFASRSLVALALLCLGCDETDGETAESRRDPGRTPVAEAAAAERPSAFPVDLTRFADDVEAFDDIASCQASLSEALPSSVGDLLADLRYDHLGSDVCTGLAAAATQNAALCDGLATRSLQEGCRRRVATHLGKPELCAAREDDTDSTCLAWASRHPWLCAGAPSTEHVVCRAVASGDEALCDEATIPSPATCRALVRRHGPSSPVVEQVPERSFEGSVELPSGTVSLSARVDRGLFVARTECESTMTIEGTGSPRVVLDLQQSGSGELRYFDGQTILGIPIAVQVRDFVFEGELGGAIRGVVEAEVELDGTPCPIRLAFDTFVRNWLDADCPTLK